MMAVGRIDLKHTWVFLPQSTDPYADIMGRLGVRGDRKAGLSFLLDTSALLFPLRRVFQEPAQTSVWRFVPLSHPGASTPSCAARI